jgi:hypothetical protein
MAKRNNRKIPFESIEQIRKKINFKDKNEFLDFYFSIISILETELDFEELIYNYLMRASKENVKYAEMFLIRAEALGSIKGLADLNFLRQKRGLSVLTANQVSSSDDFLQAVLNERRAELNFEGHRYFDLARKRKIKSVLNIEDFRSIFPIPNREIIANPNIKQNPGY